MALYVVVAILLGFYGLQKVISFYRVISKQEKQRSQTPISKLDSQKKLVFILPVYQEEELIEHTILNFSKLLNDNISLIVVGTAKERNKDGYNPTLELIRKYSSAQIQIIEYSGTTGYMAHQVNFAVRHLIASGFSETQTRLHMLNIDSRLQSDYLNEVAYNINNGVKIMLQSAIFTLNFEKLSGILKGTSIVQSRRTITGEQRRLLLNDNISNWKLFHMVGHGMIINLAKFVEYKFFPEDTFNEDMHFGYYLSVCGEKVKALSSYEVADMPTSFSDWWKQAQGRFIGAMEYHSYCQSYLRKFHKKFDLRIFMLTLQGFYNAFKRLIVSYVLIFVTVCSILSSSVILATLGVVSIVIYMLHFWLTIRYLYKKHYIKKQSITYVLYSLIIVYIRSIPATIGLLKYLGHIVGIYHYKKNKSNHK